MTTDAPIVQLVDHLVDRVPGVTGAVVSSVDGRLLASRLPASVDHDESAIAAMSAAALALANRLVQLHGDQPATVSMQRSDDGQVFVFGVGRVAVLTVLTDPAADAEQIQRVGHEIGIGLERALTGNHDSS
jgi:predicted regulator of Ras-like GTPase activity (Roadblock/LC7/MglB family)